MIVYLLIILNKSASVPRLVSIQDVLQKALLVVYCAL